MCLSKHICVSVCLQLEQDKKGFRGPEGKPADVYANTLGHGILVLREIVQYTNMDWVLLTYLTHLNSNKYG